MPNRITYLLELSNGIWTILAASLAIVCLFYLQHEIRARNALVRWRWTHGMRVAVSILTLSVGDAITRAMIFIWRHSYGGGPFTNAQFGVLTFGAIISTIGFACAIRELSEPLYGRGPWIASTVLVVAFLAFEAFVA